jgi:hypothetical protein
MFRLIKLALYVFIGYTLYEHFQNMGGQQPQQRGRGNQRRMPTGGNRSNPLNMTGPAQGRRVKVDTGDDTGGHTETVGRGVVSR